MEIKGREGTILSEVKKIVPEFKLVQEPKQYNYYDVIKAFDDAIGHYNRGYASAIENIIHRTCKSCIFGGQCEIEMLGITFCSDWREE